MTISINTPGSRPSDGYYQFEKAISDKFSSLVGKDTPIFKVDANEDALWNAYINNLPADAREHYNCNACRHFIQRFGGLVTIDTQGNIQSLIWDIVVPEFFSDSVIALNHLVLSSKVKSVFISDERALGTPKTGEWSHLHVYLPIELVNKSRLLTAGQISAEKKEQHGMLSRALNDFSLETVNTAIDLLNSETLYRGDRFLGIANWFKRLKELLLTCKNSNQRKNIIWLFVSNAPNGFCNIRSSMIGTLLDDIQSGAFTFEYIKKRFEDRMNPSNYMRSQSAPTANHLKEAEKVVEKLGIANSLARRYASICEIPNEEITWKPRDVKKAVPTSSAGVFGHLETRDKTPSSALNGADLPSTTMTWEKFQRTVLPTAVSIEALVDNPDKFMALVTATDSSAENILQWNNTFSWYYHGGIDAEMKRRVEQFGGKYDDNEIRCSLMWEGRTDLDLHCITPRREHIKFNNKRGNCGGWLDLDMNGLDKSSDSPVENLRWANNAPQGRYRIFVHNYTERVNGTYGTPFKAELEIAGQVFTYAGDPLRCDREITIFEFDYRNGQVSMLSSNVENGRASVENQWGVSGFVKVNAITKSPNLWNNGHETSGNHTFFFLEGCKDTSEGKGRGFFNEMLKPELRQIRKTLEAFTAQTPIADVDIADAFGLGYSKDKEWNLTLKVNTGSSTRLVKIDRWD